MEDNVTLRAMKIVLIGCFWIQSVIIWPLMDAASASVRDYNLVLNGEKTYDAAKLHCESRGAWLVEIQDEDIDKAVERLVQNRVIWIGLRHNAGQWRWNDGSQVRYNKWVDGNDRQLCARRGREDYWSKYGCNTKYPFVCQSDKTYAGSFNLTIMDDATLNFSQAKEACESSGMRLVDIKTNALNSAILQGLSDHTGKYWTGGNNIGHPNTYKWGDGTVISNDNRGWKELDNKGQSKHCVAISLHLSGWIDIPCSSLAKYLCQKDISSGICDNSICSNRGSCKVDGTRFKCSCNAGYFGTKCEKELVVISTLMPTVTILRGEAVQIQLEVTSYDNEVAIYRLKGRNKIDEQSFNISMIGTSESIFYDVGIHLENTTFTFEVRSRDGGIYSNSVDVQVKVTKPCDSSPCQNSGKCNYAATSPYYSCNCSSTAFEGQTCSVLRWPVRHTCLKSSMIVEWTESQSRLGPTVRLQVLDLLTSVTKQSSVQFLKVAKIGIKFDEKQSSGQGCVVTSTVSDSDGREVKVEMIANRRMDDKVRIFSKVLHRYVNKEAALRFFDPA